MITAKTKFYHSDTRTYLGKLTGAFKPGDEIELNGVRYKVMDGSQPLPGGMTQTSLPVMMATVLESSDITF